MRIYTSNKLYAYASGYAPSNGASIQGIRRGQENNLKGRFLKLNSLKQSQDICEASLKENSMSLGKN